MRAALQARAHDAAIVDADADGRAGHPESVAPAADAPVDGALAQTIARLQAPSELGVAIRAIGARIVSRIERERDEARDAIRRDGALFALVSTGHVEELLPRWSAVGEI